MIVFIVGSARSGTSAVLESLVRQYHGYSGPETHVFLKPPPSWKLRSRRRRAFLSRSIRIFFQDRIRIGSRPRAVAEEFRRLEEAYGLVIEKTPGHLTRMRMIKELLPQSVFVHCLREPESLARSLFVASRQNESIWSAMSAPVIQKTILRDMLLHLEHLGLPNHHFVRFENLAIDLRHLSLPTGRCEFMPSLSLEEEVWRKAGFTNAVMSTVDVPSGEALLQGEDGEKIRNCHRHLVMLLTARRNGHG